MVQNQKPMSIAKPTHVISLPTLPTDEVGLENVPITRFYVGECNSN